MSIIRLLLAAVAKLDSVIGHELVVQVSSEDQRLRALSKGCVSDFLTLFIRGSLYWHDRSSFLLCWFLLLSCRACLLYNL